MTSALSVLICVLGYLSRMGSNKLKLWDTDREATPAMSALLHARVINPRFEGERCLRKLLRTVHVHVY